MITWVRAKILHWLGLGLLDQYVKQDDLSDYLHREDPIDAHNIRGVIPGGMIMPGSIGQHHLDQSVQIILTQGGTRP